jgi:hypothetical protein
MIALAYTGILTKPAPLPTLQGYRVYIDLGVEVSPHQRRICRPPPRHQKQGQTNEEGMRWADTVCPIPDFKKTGIIHEKVKQWLDISDDPVVLDDDSQQQDDDTFLPRRPSRVELGSEILFRHLRDGNAFSIQSCQRRPLHVSHMVVASHPR